MERGIDSSQEKILASAREEFLRFGYQNASLRRICRQAGLTTGSLYKRFKSKDHLFVSLMQPTLDAVALYAQTQRERDYQLLDEDRMSNMWEHRQEDLESVMRVFYQHKENMRLLLFGSQGSSLENFKLDLPRMATEETYRYLEQAYKEGKVEQLIDRRFLEAAMYAYYTALIEPLAQDWPEETAISYCNQIVRLFDWGRLLGF